MASPAAVTFAPTSTDSALGATNLDAITLTITGTAVPEPSTWALLAAGFAALGAAGRRARARVGAAA